MQKSTRTRNCQQNHQVANHAPLLFHIPGRTDGGLKVKQLVIITIIIATTIIVIMNAIGNGIELFALPSWMSPMSHSSSLSLSSSSSSSFASTRLSSWTSFQQWWRPQSLVSRCSFVQNCQTPLFSARRFKHYQHPRYR